MKFLGYLNDEPQKSSAILSSRRPPFLGGAPGPSLAPEIQPPAQLSMGLPYGLFWEILLKNVKNE